MKKVRKKKGSRERALRILFQLSPATIARMIDRHPKRAVLVGRINQVQRRLHSRDYDLRA
jgi:hypothetical protein